MGHGAGHDLVLAIDLNPLDWLGGAVAGAAADGWKTAMIGLWSAGLWLLQLSFKIIDAFTTPDVSGTGPLAQVLPTTLWLGLFVVTLMMLLQLAVALIRRDGQSLGRIFVGMLQFGLVWLSYLAVAGALMVAAGGLAKAILHALLHIDSWSAFSASSSWPRSINDATAASVLGITSILLLIPASFGYLLIMLVREAALVILIATAPITAAGLVNDTSKVWFWKSLRWFIASLLIAPAAALILGVGVSLSRGVVAGAGTSTVAAAGTAVVGCVLVAIGAVCPMVLFKLLAFIEPGTGSGAALRQSMTDAGGVSGLLTGKNAGVAGMAAATQDDGSGRSAGEAAAETQTTSRMASVLGPVGAGIGAAVSMATRAADLASDVLGSAGVGDPGYSRTFADNNTSRPSRAAGSSGSGDSGQQPSDGGPLTDPPTETGPTAPPSPSAGPAGPVGGSGRPGPIPTGGAAGGAGAGAAETAVLVV
jgi:type IV secretion system protein TrbL